MFAYAISLTMKIRLYKSLQAQQFTSENIPVYVYVSDSNCTCHNTGNESTSECFSDFDLLLSIENYPHQLMAPILDKLIEKATIPFNDDHGEAGDIVSCKEQQLGTSDGCVEKSLSYFPSLPQVQTSGI